MTKKLCVKHLPFPEILKRMMMVVGRLWCAGRNTDGPLQRMTMVVGRLWYAGTRTDGP